MDATYRILKLCYPVIVIGVSDVNRKFFPIAIMITESRNRGRLFKFFYKFYQNNFAVELKI